APRSAAINCSARVERGLDPDEVGIRPLDVLDRDDVEANGTRTPFGMPHQQMTGGAHDAMALSAVDARKRRHESVTAPRPHLDDDERRSIRAHEVELAETATVALEQRRDAEIGRASCRDGEQNAEAP